jgi:hypothetical protein
MSEDNTAEKAARAAYIAFHEGLSGFDAPRAWDDMTSPADDWSQEAVDWEYAIKAALASRDPEVAVLRERVAELEAVIEKVREWNTLTNGRPRYRECDDIISGDKCWWADVDGGGLWFPHDFYDGSCVNCFRQEESVSSPSEVLAAVRQEAAAEAAASALEDVAHEWSDKTWLRVLTQSLVTRAAEIRAGGNR